MTHRPAWHLLEGGASRATPHPTVIAAAHGLQDGWRTWVPLAQRLPAGIRIYALDLPWRTANDYRWRLAASASQHLAQALQTLPEHPDVLAAHSLGANAALEYLTRAPARAGRLRAAVLAAPFYRAEGSPADRTVCERHRETFSAVMTDAVRSRLGQRAHDLGEGVLASMVQTALARLDPQALAVLSDSYLTSRTLDLSTVRLPVLVAVGEKDPGSGADQISALTTCLPAARLRVYPRIGHFVMHEAPDSFAADIEEFLIPRGTAIGPSPVLRPRRTPTGPDASGHTTPYGEHHACAE
ncbi:hypothetical protein GCM10010252_30240 [Streptomyces aureoverticillatus]|nr:hypothetical protein GCM10010252_30240 [Streptomyces aureoverticillatus]